MKVRLMPYHETMSRQKWYITLRQMLIEAGPDGLKQSHITHYFCHKAGAEELKEVLDFWKEIGAAQKFRIDGKAHRPITIWRATQKLLEVD